MAPGFIDIHSHSDLQVLDGRKEKLKQGVTLEVVGNCGFSPFPHSGDVAALREFGAGILGQNRRLGLAECGGLFESAGGKFVERQRSFVGGPWQLANCRLWRGAGNADRSPAWTRWLAFWTIRWRLVARAFRRA